MANLVERLTGQLTPAEVLDPENNKLGIHAFVGALSEWERGHFTRASIVSIFNLSAAQENQLDSLKSLYVASTQKTEFVRVFKDLMFMGEANVIVGNPSPFLSQYRDIAFVQQRLEDEVTENGGTLPSPVV